MVTLYYETNPFKNHLDFFKNVVKIASYRIANDQNWIANISGSTGSGKSVAALFLAEEIQKETLPSVPFAIEQVVLNGTEFLKLIVGKNPLPKGSVIIWDEMGVGMNAKKAMSALNIALNNVFQVFRSRNYVFISTTPDQNFIDKSTRKLMHCFMKAEKINRKEMSNKISINTLQFNPNVNKTYYHNIKVKIKGEPLMIMPVLHTIIPNDALYQQYLKKKEAFNNKIFNKTLDILKKIEDLRPLTEKQEKVYEMNQSGLTQAEIGKTLGKGADVISKTLALIKKKGYTVKKRGENEMLEI
jgi:hypothetical protein